MVVEEGKHEYTLAGAATPQPQPQMRWSRVYYNIDELI